jgi:FtsZ-binding cell division protein ZapB
MIEIWNPNMTDEEARTKYWTLAKEIHQLQQKQIQLHEEYDLIENQSEKMTKQMDQLKDEQNKLHEQCVLGRMDDKPGIA